MTGTLTDAPEVRAIFAWLDRHARDVEEAPFWRAYRDTRGTAARLDLLRRYVLTRPGDRILGRFDPDVLRAAVVVSYLRGRFHALDLEPLACDPWPWQRICDLAETQGAGWDSFQDVDSARGALRVFRMRGYLDIPTAPVEAADTIAAMLATLAADAVPVATFTPAATDKAA